MSGRLWDRVVHQTDSYFEDVVAEDKVGEAVPGALGAFFDALAGVEERFTAVVEARHTGAGDVITGRGLGGKIEGGGRNQESGIGSADNSEKVWLYIKTFIISFHGLVRGGLKLLPGMEHAGQ